MFQGAISPILRGLSSDQAKAGDAFVVSPSCRTSSSASRPWAGLRQLFRLSVVSRLMDVRLRCRFCGFGGLFDFGLRAGRKGQLIHKLGVFTLHQHGGVVGDGVEQRVEPCLVGLGEIAEHMTMHAVLVSRVADAEAQAAIFLAAMGVEGFQAVMATMSATGLDARAAGRQVQLIVNGDDVAGASL